MNIKSLFIGVAIGVMAAGGVCIYTSQKNQEGKKTEVNAEIETKAYQTDEEVKEEEEVLTIVKSEKKYLEEYNSENYVVTLKSNSAKRIAKIEFSFGESNYELYNLSEGETYKVIAYSNEKDIELEIKAIYYTIDNYYPDEVSLSYTQEENKVIGKIKNNGERKLYPNQIIAFFRDSDGDIIEKTVEYSGCFFEDRVIKAGEEFEFEIDIPEDYSLFISKGMIFKYSDIEFKEYVIKEM